MLQFQQPWWLVLLLAIPLLSLWFVKKGQAYEGVLRFSSIKLFDTAATRSAGRKARLLRVLQYLLMTILIIALARPQKSDVVRESQIEVIDIMMVLDIS
ncbi:MAG: BatA domain-containing protein, partial [Candidatus Marinimicrobia bacterium]|nr:BatA domain-containing protein [Candidatus Neomarinimicrobiota bacterium]